MQTHAENEFGDQETEITMHTFDVLEHQGGFAAVGLLELVGEETGSCGSDRHGGVADDEVEERTLRLRVAVARDVREASTQVAGLSVEYFPYIADGAPDDICVIRLVSAQTALHDFDADGSAELMMLSQAREYDSDFGGEFLNTRATIVNATRMTLPSAVMLTEGPLVDPSDADHEPLPNYLRVSLASRGGPALVSTTAFLECNCGRPSASSSTPMGVSPEDTWQFERRPFCDESDMEEEPVTCGVLEEHRSEYRFDPESGYWVSFGYNPENFDGPLLESARYNPETQSWESVR